MSTYRSRQVYTTKQAMGTNDRKACLECGGDITNKMRSTFCCKICSDAFRIRISPAMARQLVFERDRGVCGLCCKDVFAEPDKFGTPRTPRSRGSGDLWQADHIVPVVEGGGQCGIENYRTLCTACHRDQTAKLAARRAKQRLVNRALPLLDSTVSQETGGLR